jgi:hypothetical protein
MFDGQGIQAMSKVAESSYDANLVVSQAKVGSTLHMDRYQSACSRLGLMAVRQSVFKITSWGFR